MLLAVLDVAAYYFQAGPVLGLPADYARDEHAVGLHWQVGLRVAPDIALSLGYRSIGFPATGFYFDLDHMTVLWNVHDHMFPFSVTYRPTISGRLSLVADAYVELGVPTSGNTSGRISDPVQRAWAEGIGARLGLTERLVGGAHPLSVGATLGYSMAHYGFTEAYSPPDAGHGFGWLSLDAFAEVGFR